MSSPADNGFEALLAARRDLPQHADETTEQRQDREWREREAYANDVACDTARRALRTEATAINSALLRMRDALDSVTSDHGWHDVDLEVPESLMRTHIERIAESARTIALLTPPAILLRPDGRPG